MPPNKNTKQSRRIRLFCYGSLNTEMIESITGTALSSPPRPAMLPNHIRIFAGEGGYWGGAVASVHPRKGSRVYGAVVALTPEEFERVDYYEGGYTRKKRMVHIIDPATQKLRPVMANVYVRDDSSFVEPPTKRYIRSIQKTLQEVGLQNHDYIPIHGLFVTTTEEGKKRTVLTELVDEASASRKAGLAPVRKPKSTKN